MVVQNPSDQILFEYGQFIRMHEDQEARLAKVRDLPAITLDDHPVALEANLINPRMPLPSSNKVPTGWGSFVLRIPFSQSNPVAG